MKKSKVFFASARAKIWDVSYSLPFKLEELLLKIDLKKYITHGDKVAVKMHFGGRGAFRTIRPVFVRKVVNSIKKTGGKPFVTDTTRIEALQYLEVATENGYTQATCGAPVIIADGIFGRDAVPVKVEGAKYIKEIEVASSIYHAEAMVVLSHFKGHIGPGFGGAIKNIGMGGVSPKTREGKLNRGRLHSVDDKVPKWIKEKCSWCKQCEDICPVTAITIIPKEIYEINDELCWRCGRCARICKKGALDMPITQERLCTHIVEASQAVLSTFKPNKIIFVNFIMDVQPECDCMPVADTPVVNDQGIMISDDPVAIDKASLDMVNNAGPLPQSSAEDLGIKSSGNVLGIINKRDTDVILNIAEEYKLGTKNYEIIEVKKKEGDVEKENWE
ncbi:MAG: DUF362 domain-containing protein [Candidatus Firestonebacteria bacterium]